MENALESVPSRAALRDLLSKILVSDRDLEAFCLDYFPDTQRRFGQGMDRLSKTNLLLELSSTEEILKQLLERFSSDTAAQTLLSQYLNGYTVLKKTSQAQELASQLEPLYILRDQNLRHGLDISDINQKIIAIKRTHRQGPQLNEGDIFAERYRLLEVVGRGGFAKVWQAFDRELERLVAIKILHHDLSEDRNRIERFERGARKMMQLTHPHIVRVLAEPAQHDGYHYFVMEYMDGGDLGRSILAGKLDRDHSLAIVLQTGEALAYAHSHNLIHRDVKPFNILLDGKLSARLTDFDLVLAQDSTGGTRTGALGTFIYAAPEELEDASSVDFRADVYSLGMTALFALYQKSLPVSAFRRGVYFVDQIECPRGLKAVLRRAVAWHVEERYPSINAFCEDLKRVISSPLSEPATDEGKLSYHSGNTQDDTAIPVLIQEDANMSIAGSLSKDMKELSTVPTQVDSELTVPLRNLSQEPAVAVNSESSADGNLRLILPLTLSNNFSQEARPQDLKLSRMAVPLRKEKISTARIIAMASIVTTIFSVLALRLFIHKYLVNRSVKGQQRGEQNEDLARVQKSQEAENEISKLDNILREKQWLEVVAKADSLLTLSYFNDEQIELIQNRRAVALMEVGAQQIFEQFRTAVSASRYLDAVYIFKSIPERSDYRRRLESEYDLVVKLSIRDLISKVDGARVAHSCADFGRHMQQLVELAPANSDVLSAQTKPCVEATIKLALPTKRSLRVLNGQKPKVQEAQSDDSQISSVSKDLAADQNLAEAQTAFANGEYQQTIEKSQKALDFNPKRAWRLIGQSACSLKNIDLANKAFHNSQGTIERRHITVVCQKHGLFLKGTGFVAEE